MLKDKEEQEEICIREKISKEIKKLANDLDKKIIDSVEESDEKLNKDDKSDKK